MNDFDLTVEPWVPVVMSSTERRRLSLRDVLVNAHEIQEVSGPSPVIAAALYRVLVAFAHRMVGRVDLRSWTTAWEFGKFDPGVVEGYLERWRPRLKLFDPERPFMQAPGLPLESAQPLARLAHDRQPTNNHEFLDHPHPDPVFRPAQAALQLLAHQAFALGGLATGRLPGEPTSLRAAPLAKAAVVVVKGDNLFRTLMLNLAPVAGFTSISGMEDRAAWERDTAAQGVERSVTGPVDLLTWQSRRVLLLPEGGDGGTVVRQVISKQGDDLPAGWKNWEVEPMVAYRAVKKAKAGADPWMALGLRPDRMAWRDSNALFQAGLEDGAESLRPATLTWLAALSEAGVLARHDRFRLDVFGLNSYQAKIEFWRTERIPLPLAIVSDRDCLAEVRSGLAAAERAGDHLQKSMWRLATLLICPNEGKAGALPADPGRVKLVAAGFGATDEYWNRLESGFVAFLDDLASEEFEAASLRWRKCLRDTVRTAAYRVFNSLDSSARALKAMTDASRQFHGGLDRALSISKEAA